VTRDGEKTEKTVKGNGIGSSQWTLDLVVLVPDVVWRKVWRVDSQTG